MTAKTRKRLFIIGGAIVGIFLSFAHFRQRDSYYCQTCWSRKDETQWRLGLWPDTSIPLTPKWEGISETRFLHDLLPTNHVHQWQFAQGSPYYLFGTTWGGCAIGGGRHISEVCRMYESSPEFREFIQAKLNDGSLSKSNLVTLVAAPPNGDISREEERALLETFFNK